MRVLLVGSSFSPSMLTSLRKQAFAIDEVRTFAGAPEAIGRPCYDCIVLDRDVVGGDLVDLGDVLARVERPSIFVVVQPGDAAGRLDCLTAGADDAIAKPLHDEEFALRVRKLIVRRTPGGPWVQVGDVSIDRVRVTVHIADEQVPLSTLQFSVLEQLAIYKGEFVEQSWLLEHCWKAGTDRFANPVHSLVNRLRRTFHGHLVIEAPRGSGYLLRASSDEVVEGPVEEGSA